jgi:hypothetical protein
MKYKYIPMFKGITKDVSARIIPEDKCQDGSNIIFKDGLVKRRFGYKSFGNNLPLSGSIMGLFAAEFLTTGGNFLLAFTNRDAYTFNFTTGNWDFITQIYNTGTVAIVGTDATVTLSTGAWQLNTIWSKLSIYQIMFGSDDPNSGGEWHTVLSITDATHLELATAHATITNQAYCLRLCFSGGTSDYFSVAQPFDVELSDKTFVVTNGVDYIQRWDGTGYFYDYRQTIFAEGTLTDNNRTITNIDETNISADMIITVINDIAPLDIPANTVVVSTGTDTVLMSASAAVSQTCTLMFVGDRINKAKHVGFYGSIGYEHLILSNTTDSTGANKQRVETSNAASLFFEGTYYDLLNSTDEILGIVPLQTNFIIYKENSISQMIPNPSGGNEDPFQINQNKASVGTVSIRTIFDMGQLHIFFGNDNIYGFDGVNVEPIGAEVIQDIRKNINRPYYQNMFAGVFPNEDLYCLFVPYNYSGQDLVAFSNRAYVFDYKDKTWSIWDFNKNMTAIASYREEYSPTWVSKIVSTVTISSTTTIGSAVISVASTVGIAANMQVKGTGIPRTTSAGDSVKVLSFVPSTSITINANATANGTADIRYIEGDDFDEQGMRFEDMIVYANNKSNIIGDSDGNVYKMNSSYQDDNGTDILSTFTTKDYTLNEPKQNFKLLESVISFLTSNGEFIKIRASVDFGATWTDCLDIPMDGTATHKEYLVNFIERGRNVRFELANKDSAYFEIESISIGYNDAGIDRDY